MIDLQKLEKYKGVIYFVVALLSAHFFWKYTVLGEEAGSQVTFFGWDISQPFVYMAAHTADISHKILNMIGYNTTMYAGNIISHPNMNAVCVVWACTGIKQTFIFFVIMLFARGPWKHKLWYIPLGIISIYLFNIFRIVAIIAIIKNHMEWFDFFHEHILKYLFYAMLFMWWVYWEEKIVPKYLADKKNENP